MRLVLSERQREALRFAVDPGRYWLSCEGAIRSGKSHATMLAFLIYTQTGARRDQEHLIAGRTVSSLRRNVLEPMRREVESLGGEWKYVRVDGLVNINGVHYAVAGAMDELAQDRIQGMTAGSALLDELARMPMSFIEQAQARTTYEDSKIWSTLNPEGPRHPVKAKLELLVEAGQASRLRFTLDDNPVLAESVKARYRAQFSGVFYARFIEGKWAAAAGAIWPVRETRQPPVERARSYDIAVDYATSSTFASLLVARYQGQDRVEHEFYRRADEGRSMTDADLADAFVDAYRPWLRDRRVAVIWVDPSASSFKAELRKRKLGMPVRSAWNDVLPGIRIVGTRFSRGTLSIGSNCTELLGEAYSYQWDEKAQAQGEDRPVKSDDHGPDALRYQQASRYRRSSGGTLAKPEGW